MHNEARNLATAFRHAARHGVRATELFEAAYDEHARRLARLYQELGA